MSQTAFPGPAAAPAAAPVQPAASPAAQATAGGAEMFWHHLAWQLLQTPAVRQALGDRAEALTEGPERLKALECGIGCLRADEMQQAFRDLTAGRLEQNSFISRFAARLTETLRGVGALAPAGT